MRGFESMTKLSRVAGILLLLVIGLMGANGFAQSSNPVPWPLPTVPPVPPIIPDRGGEPTGFDITGFIQYASLDATPGLCNKDDNPAPTPANPPLPAQCKTTGGWMELNGTVIRVPQNTVVIFPNTLLTWEEAFELNPNLHQTDAVYQTGLAMSDTVRFPGTYQGHIQGNIVNGQYIAGLVFIYQDPANMLQGFIESIDYPNGVLVVNGTRIQINDPALTYTIQNPDGTPLLDGSGNPQIVTKGRYSAGQSADPRFAVDQNNPTVAAQTGYPMCIARSAPGTYTGSDGVPDPYPFTVPVGAVSTGMDDPLCPEVNRPRDPNFNLTFQNIYTMNAPGAAPTPDNPFPQDPYVEAPFEVGDFVQIIGTLEVDPNTQVPFMTATDILNTSVGLYTWPNTDPGYIRIEVVIQGTGGTPNPSFPQEAGVRTRVEGFVTDPLRTVDVSAVDQDCNGNLTFREPSWTANFPVEPGPPGIGVKGRWRMRFPQGGDFLPAVQNVGARISGSSPGKNKNGLTFSEYQLPSGEFIFPENLVPGSRPPKSNFGDILFLNNGLGPLPMVSDVFDSSQVQLGQQPSPFFPNQIQGQLNPFPDNTAPALTCFPGITGGSTAIARASSTPSPAFAGVTVTLDASASTPANGPFLWKQVLNPSDPVVVINNPTSVKATFVAPLVSSAQNLTFSLQVGDGNAVPVSNTQILVPIVLPPAVTAPQITSAIATGPAQFPTPANPTVSGSSITVNSGVLVTLSATAVDSASQSPVTFTWTAPPGITLSSTTGSSVTFTTPNVPVLTANQVFNFTVTATSPTSGLVSAPATVTVSVAPVSDRIVISNVVYRRTKGRLIVNASDFTPGVTLTCTLDILNPATGLPFSGVMGPIIPFAQGVFSIRFSNIPPPNLVTITSSAGGVATSGVTALR